MSFQYSHLLRAREYPFFATINFSAFPDHSRCSCSSLHLYSNLTSSPPHVSSTTPPRSCPRVPTISRRHSSESPSKRINSKFVTTSSTVSVSHTVSSSSAPTGLCFLLFLPSRERERRGSNILLICSFVLSVGFESCLGVDAREKGRILRVTREVGR